MGAYGAKSAILCVNFNITPQLADIVISPIIIHDTRCDEEFEQRVTSLSRRL